MNPRLLAGALLIAAALHIFALVNETRAPAAFDTAAGLPPTSPIESALPTSSLHGRLPTAAPDRLMPAFSASTPYPTLTVASLPRSEPTLTVASLPRSEPKPVATVAPTATPTSVPDRSGCDPAYPDEDTCIPFGPPFDRGCAVTAERRFTVLPPDPQRLDHDNDGIGCEPMR